jgi:hypothetical protein
VAERDELLGGGEELIEGRPVERIPVEQDAQQSHALGRHPHALRQAHRLALDVAQQVDVVDAVEGRLAADHLEQHGAGRPQVRLVVVPLVLQDLRRHVPASERAK